MTITRAELHELVDALPAEQVPLAGEDLRRRTTRQKPFAWVAMGPAKNGRTDNARRVDEALAESFGR